MKALLDWPRMLASSAAIILFVFPSTRAAAEAPTKKTRAKRTTSLAAPSPTPQKDQAVTMTAIALAESTGQTRTRGKSGKTSTPNLVASKSPKKAQHFSGRGLDIARVDGEVVTADSLRRKRTAKKSEPVATKSSSTAKGSRN